MVAAYLRGLVLIPKQMPAPQDGNGIMSSPSRPAAPLRSISLARAAPFQALRGSIRKTLI